MNLSCELAGDGLAVRYAEQLLCSLGIRPRRAPGALSESPAVAWARSGLMALTGRADGPPLLCPAPLAACADGALTALAALAAPGSLDGLRGSALMTERAAIAGHRRNGTVSPGGSCRLLPAADGWLALNLSREDDWALLPAWLEEPGPRTGDWDALAPRLAQRTVGEWVERGRLLGLALAAETPSCREPARWYRRLHGTGAAAPEHSRDAPLVVDLSALWAGPLCSHLLQRLGARVIKLESPGRPDGARHGPPAFFDLLNAGKQSLALDLATPLGRRQLHALLLRADILIEGSRPRGLRQLGIQAEALIDARPQLTWVAISGHGRGLCRDELPQDNWIAYGDDAAIAAGLSDCQFRACGEHLVVGDAIADPLTGLHAALAAWSHWLTGSGGLLSLALSEVVRHAIAFDTPADDAGLRRRMGHWQAEVAGLDAASPRARAPAGRAPAIGADTAALIAELDLPC